ncbi:lipopolysaccharide biosynthesis protein [Arthrobacter sp. NPDC056727]|uniref:lipopolysaccharide biosynthesis protein n=1 Tax=Arthrobacter sp. NPDC056727 TaxID=3345927 RepID=UPI00367201FC
MTGLIRSLWSLMERLVPRASSSLLMLLLAWRTSPEIVGLYVWGVLAYTFVGSLTDATMRQLVVSALRSDKGVELIRAYRRLVVVLGPLVLLLFFLVLWLVSGPDHKSAVLTLLPLALGPAFMAVNIFNIGRLQGQHEWRALATGQLVASLAAMTVGVPLVLLLTNPSGAAIGTVLGELVMMLWCWNATRRLEPYTPVKIRSRRLLREYRSMAAYSGLAWGQGQTDRVFVGAVAGGHTLGVLSLGISLARALGDAVAASSANLLRAELASADTAERAAVGRAVLRRGMFLAAATAFLTAAVAKWILSPILGEEWSPALEIVPILSLCVIPSVLSWSAAIYHVDAATGKKALIGPIASIFIALPVATLSFWSLPALAVGVVLREFTLVTVAYFALGPTAPWRSLGQAVLLTSGLFVVVLVVSVAG